MFQDDTSVGWDPASVHPHLSLCARLYLLFLLVAIAVTTARLVRLWIAAPPFLLSRQTKNPDYLQKLRTTRVSIMQWMICIFLACVLVVSTEIVRVFDRLVTVKPDTTFILFAVRDLSAIPGMAASVALCLFLAQWHLLNRMGRFGQ
jgi:hypothetical protein